MRRVIPWMSVISLLNLSHPLWRRYVVVLSMKTLLPMMQVSVSAMCAEAWKLPAVRYMTSSIPLWTAAAEACFRMQSSQCGTADIVSRSKQSTAHLSTVCFMTSRLQVCLLYTSYRICAPPSLSHRNLGSLTAVYQKTASREPDHKCRKPSARQRHHTACSK